MVPYQPDLFSSAVSGSFFHPLLVDSPCRLEVLPGLLSREFLLLSFRQWDGGHLMLSLFTSVKILPCLFPLFFPMLPDLSVPFPFLFHTSSHLLRLLLFFLSSLFK